MGKSGDTFSCPEILRSGACETVEGNDLISWNRVNNLSPPGGAGVKKINEEEESFVDKSGLWQEFLRAGFPGSAGCPGKLASGSQAF